MFEVTLTDGRKIRRHADQLRSRAPSTTVAQEVAGNANGDNDDFDVRIPNTQENTETTSSVMESEQAATIPTETETSRVDESSDRNESSLPRTTSEGSPHDTSERDTTESSTDTSSNQPIVQRSNRARNPLTYYSHSDLVT